MSEPHVRDRVAELFKALSSPTRLAVLERLATGPACVHELVEELHESQPLVSQHLKVLRAARLVHGQRDGREIRYELVDHHVADVVADAVAHVSEEDHGDSTPIPITSRRNR